jgi:peptidoglycan/xylan/chitin deacetylase (PgdA/CDA1 family)
VGRLASRLSRQRLAVGLALTAKVAVVAPGFWRSDPLAAAAIFFGSDLWVLHGLLYPNATSLMPVVTRFVTTQREVWLTIDDGPEPATTSAMLDLLDRHEARATFFVIGRKVAAAPALVAEILRRGHSVGNHTHTHPLATFWGAGPDRTEEEIERCNAALAAAGAPRPAWFRPPAGIKTLWLDRVLAQNGQRLIGWSHRGLENLGATPVRPLQRLTKGLQPGAILLVHESARRPSQRLELLGRLLTHLTAAKYRCVLPFEGNRSRE